MDFNVKELVETAVTKLKNDNDLMDDFKKEPVKTLETLLKIDLPDEKMTALVDGVKAKLGVDGIASKLSGLKNLFNK